MQRIDFLKKLSFTTLLVAGIRNQTASEPNLRPISENAHKDQLPTYPMAGAEKIKKEIVRKIYKEGMELDTFLKLFSEELKTQFPVLENTDTSTYRSLYCASIRSEVLILLVITLVEVWQNLCLQFGLKGYGKKEFESDSIQIQNSILSLGEKLKIGNHPHFFLKTKEDLPWGPLKVDYLVPWFGSKKTESIQFFPLPLGIDFELEETNSSQNSPDTTYDWINSVLSILNQFLSRLKMNRAIWHQYSVRFYFLNFAEREFLKNQNQRNGITKNQKSLDLLGIRYSSFVSAIQTIKERAFHMQSGVYHGMDRQNQQMVVSSLVQVIGQISIVTGGDKDVCKRLRLANHYGGILTVSTAAMARESLPLIDDALSVLQKERKVYFP
ncbi:hypothetical protein EHQ24_16455 [Leptospira noumeaensis]|uniref:Uncharacterized protein n=1 Tax=Leptospira noumeaensis TaxID=2484964 RepID=A0A4R9I1C2_9LEPT|nr:hypothetical protein [Leptospira noumeaensis]TGK79138.1 hypothetical protein EHQ24_16455 [Leptospira noumeaensis]